MTDTDIVTRLRSQMLAATYSPLMLEAADELERLAAQVVERGKVAIDRGNQLIAANCEISRLRDELANLAEACAKMCESEVPQQERFDDQRAAGNTARACASAIRARFVHSPKPLT